MATYKDLARHTGLSLATISKYFNGGVVREANRAALDAAVAVLGYRVNPAARSLRKGRSFCVGVLLPALDNAFHMTVVAELERSLRASGIGLLVSVTRAGEPGEAVSFLRERGADAIIAVPSPADADALVTAAAEGTPLVAVDWLIDGPGIDAVTLDNRGAGAMAAQHLLDLGHRDVAIVGGPAEISSLRDRSAGFVERLALRGVAMDEARALQVDLTVADGAAATSRLLYAGERPTAIFTANYELTVGALGAIADAGLVLGSDISLIGFDGAELAGLFRPRLTTIVQPTKALAGAAADHVLQRLASPEAQPAPVALAAELVIGGSVARVVR